MRFLETDEIDRRKWDECVKRSRVGHIYGLSWYLDLVASRWVGIVEDDYRSVMPLPVRERFGINYVFQPDFTQQLGVYGSDIVKGELLKTFIEAIPGKLKYVDTNLNYTNQSDNLVSGITKKVNYELDLRKKYIHLREKYSDNTRRNIQRSIPFIEIVEDVSVADLIRMIKENSLRKKPREYYEWMNCFAYKLVRNGYGKITGALKDGKLCAATLIVYYSKRVYYLISVSDETGKQNRAMFAIIDHIIQTCSDKNLFLDFEGSNISGIARFFEGFGGVSSEYPSLKINRLPRMIRFLKR